MQHSDRHTTETTEVVSREVNISISAWMDGDGEAEMPQAIYTESGREAWQVYHLIGDALRTPELVRPVSSAFGQRLSSAIAAESTLSSASDAESSGRESQSHAASPAPTSIEAKSHRHPVRTGWRLVWPGLAMAAAVASVVWMARPFFVPESSAPVQQMASADPVTVKSPAMRDYVSAHRQIAGPTGVRPVSFGASR